MRKSNLFVAAMVAAPLLVSMGVAEARGGPDPAEPVVVGSSFPDDFPEIPDDSTGDPVIGFGGEGRAWRTPVIFLHGNNDVPYPTVCSPYGDMQEFAQYFADQGYRASELWGLGYQGDQCDLLTDQTIRSGESHTVTANVPDLRRFVDAVLESTGAQQVDIVAHSLGVTLAREWMRQDRAYPKVRHLVGLAGPEHGIINCSPNPLNYFQLPSQGGFTPDAPVCQELGSPDTAFLQRLNERETRRPTRYLTLRNADTDFVYISALDGLIPPVPAEDSFGNPNDFSDSPFLDGACNVSLEGQGAYDPLLGTGHLGIAASPTSRELAHSFITTDRSPCSKRQGRK
jgi:pimeloyl-ACP methyl ester carboxylesterase